MLSQGSDPVHQTPRRLAGHLQKVGIPHAMVGALAVKLHGGRPMTEDVVVLMTPRGLERFRQEFVGREYDQVPGRSRRFTDREHGTGIEILVTGLYPGRSGPGPFTFPDPAEVSEEIDQVRVVTLPQLVQLKLAARRSYDLADVVSLVQAHDLDESFSWRLHPAVRQDFMKCVEEKRREKEFEARNG